VYRTREKALRAHAVIRRQIEHAHRERRYSLDDALCPKFESAKSVLKVHTS
jgi:hypothetical protein